MNLTNAVRLFAQAVEAPHKPGLRILNATARNAWTADPVADIFRNWWGNSVDISYFEQHGNEYASAFDVTRIRDEFGVDIKQSVDVPTHS
jgi:hypothetical protein